LLLKKEHYTVLVVIRRRLTAQGNGQATLDRPGTRRPAAPGDLVPAPREDDVKMAAR
jgi:hypothetical protein